MTRKVAVTIIGALLGIFIGAMIGRYIAQTIVPSTGAVTGLINAIRNRQDYSLLWRNLIIIGSAITGGIGFGGLSQALFGKEPDQEER